MHPIMEAYHARMPRNPTTDNGWPEIETIGRTL